MTGIIFLGVAFLIASCFVDADSFYKDTLYDPCNYFVRVA